MTKNSDLDFDRNRVLLFGHSAGGNLAVGVSLLAAESLSIKAQILSYPFLDVFIDPKKRKYIKYPIPAFVIKRFNNSYFPDKTKRREPLASPLYAESEKILRGNDI